MFSVGIGRRQRGQNNACSDDRCESGGTGLHPFLQKAVSRTDMEH
jgi:hypothetical protein